MPSHVFFTFLAKQGYDSESDRDSTEEWVDGVDDAQQVRAHASVGLWLAYSAHLERLRVHNSVRLLGFNRC